MGCKQVLHKKENILCLKCYSEVPYIDKKGNNALNIEWADKLEVNGFWACMYFNKGGLVQMLIHALKYRGEEKVGQFIGKRLSKLISNQEHQIDIVTSVPLHSQRLKKRGFNQADLFAQTLASELNISFHPILKRVKNTKTQTQMSRLERAENVQDAFALISQNKFEGKHVLVVDDVLTTGATMQSCVKLLDKNGMKVSVAVMAMAR